MRQAPVGSSQWRGVVAAAIVVMYSSACTSWHVVGPTPADYVQTHRPREVHVTRTDRSRIALRTPELRGDTLFGMAGGGLAQGDTLRRVIIPVADVQTIAARQFSLGKTLALSLAIVLSLALIAGSGSDSFHCGCIHGGMHRDP